VAGLALSGDNSMLAVAGGIDSKSDYVYVFIVSPQTGVQMTKGLFINISREWAFYSS
jgi:hypothetical protein